MKITEDLADFLFRALFCLIFVGLGMEHIFSDALIQKLMPAWVPLQRSVSIFCGVWLVAWGSFIFLGWRIKEASIALGAFLIVVTILVHVPGILETSQTMPSECHWCWQILQRSNLVKNICLLGVCFWLLHHKPGKYSLDAYLERRKGAP